MAKFATVEAVPLVKTGTWNGSTGSKAITKEDLEAIVEAHESAVLDKGVLKKGHLDPRHQNPAWDGDPAYGQVDNLRLSDDGETLLGDYINVPEDLAESLPSAYPNRSAEIAWGVKLKDAAGKVTKEFKAALAGVALLGRTPPAVKGLGGPVSAFSAGSVEFDGIGVFSMVTEFSLPGGLTANALREALSTAITDEFKAKKSLDGEYAEWPWMIDYDDTKAWFRANGGVFQVGYTASDAGVITLNDDVTEVIEKRTYVPVPDTATVPQTQLSEMEATNVQGAESANAKATREEPSMSEYLKKLRDKLGLPETATEEEILTAAAEAVQEPAPESTDSKVDADGKPVVETTEQTNNSAGKHAAPAAGDSPETVIVSAAAFSELMESNQSNATRLAAMEAAERKRRVDSLVKDYTKAGKIHPSEKSFFSAQLETNETETRKLLDARAGIPVAAIGSENVDAVSFSEGDTDFGPALKFFNLEGN